MKQNTRGPRSRAGLMAHPLEIPHRRSDHSHQKPDDQRTKVRSRSHLVVLLGDGEDAEDQKRGEDDFIAEGVPHRNPHRRMREENSSRAAGRPRQVLHRVELVDHRPEEPVHDARAQQRAHRLRRAVGEHLLPREFAVERQRQSHCGIGMAAADRAGGVNGDGDRQAPCDAHAPVRVLVGAGIVEAVHRRHRVAEGDDDEQRHGFRDELPGILSGQLRLRRPF